MSRPMSPADGVPAYDPAGTGPLWTPPAPPSWTPGWPPPGQASAPVPAPGSSGPRDRWCSAGVALAGLLAGAGPRWARS
jgi:hypothetical protein